MTRTKMTAENFLNGLYPPNTRAKDDVITLNTYPSQIETLALNTVVCPNLTALYSLFKATTYTDQIKANYALFSKVNTMMGWTKVPTYNQTLTVMCLCRGTATSCRLVVVRRMRHSV